MEKTSEILRDRLPRVYSRELVEILYSNVYTKIANLVDAKIASRNIADNYLAKLEELGIIKAVFDCHKSLQIQEISLSYYTY